MPESEAKALRELAEAAIATAEAMEKWTDADDADPKVQEYEDDLEAKTLQERAALARLRDLSSPGIPDNSKGGGK